MGRVKAVCSGWSRVRGARVPPRSSCLHGMASRRSRHLRGRGWGWGSTSLPRGGQEGYGPVLATGVSLGPSSRHVSPHGSWLGHVWRARLSPLWSAEVPAARGLVAIQAALKLLKKERTSLSAFPVAVGG